jgi:hypothetical protein
MTARAISIETELDELAALRRAVALMGFDPQRLAAFVADGSDFACKSILLSSMALDGAKLSEQGASNLAGWRSMLATLQPSR